MNHFNNIKDSIKSTLIKNTDESKVSEVSVKVAEPLKITNDDIKLKKRRGRPSKQRTETKLNKVLKSRNMTRKDLYVLICEKYPDEPISPDAVSRIVSGSRLFYSTTTLFRICGALNITPNMALDYEQHI